MMGADFVAVEARPLKDLAGSLPWWMEHLALLAIGITIGLWWFLRRWIGGSWAALAGYLLALPVLVHFAQRTIDARVDRIDLVRSLDANQETQLESDVGARVLQRGSTGHPTQVFFLRDPERRDRIAVWLADHVR